jgi:nicotinamidase-related amidase
MRKEALLVVDMLNDFVKEGAPLEVPAAREILPRIRKKIKWARENKIPVVYICDSHRPKDGEFTHWPAHAVEGTPGAEVVEEIFPQGEDFVVKKRRYSAFLGTELDLLLRELKVNTLHLTGILTNICILYTACDAVMRDYEVVVWSDCVASVSPQDHNFALNQMRDVLKVKVKK